MSENTTQTVETATNLAEEQKALLQRILFTAQITIDGFAEKDTGDRLSDVHVAIMAMTMIKMDVMRLLTGEDLFTKALQEVIVNVSVPPGAALPHSGENGGAE